MRARSLVLALLFCSAPLACKRAAPDATPDGAVRVWLEKMEGASEEPRLMRDAVSLLGPEARANLEERAARASRMQGRRVEAHEMLAEGRFGLRFRPKRMTSHVSGATATVDVEGSDQAANAHVRCVREGAGWKVEPELPELPPIVKRSE